METKKCTKCEQVKPLSEFYVKNKKINRYHSQCKVCSEANRKSKEHYEKYKSEYIKRNKERKDNLALINREKLLEYLSTHHCVECGESNPIMLEFDHIDRKNKNKGISTMMYSYTWEQILEEINKCEVVCANHHKVRTAQQFGWYKLKIKK